VQAVSHLLVVGGTVVPAAGRQRDRSRAAGQRPALPARESLAETVVPAAGRQPRSGSRRPAAGSTSPNRGSWRRTVAPAAGRRPGWSVQPASGRLYQPGINAAPGPRRCRQTARHPPSCCAGTP
jgi:hypothetical protein